jgi:hypothetical protein
MLALVESWHRGAISHLTLLDAHIEFYYVYW